MKSRALIIGAVLAFGGGMLPSVSGQAAPAGVAAKESSRDATWVRAFAASGPPSTSGSGIGRENQLNWDPRFKALLAAAFPQKQWFWYDRSKLTPLPEMMQQFIGVPGNAILDEDRFVTVDGCVPHDCDGNRGMLWVDTGAKPAFLIFAGLDGISSNAPPFKSHLWIYTSQKLNWQKVPASFLSCMHRWLTTIGQRGYFGTDGYRYNFAVITIVQPSGVMVDLGPDVFDLSASEMRATSGKGL